MKTSYNQSQLDNWLKMSADIITNEQVVASQRNDEHYLKLLSVEMKLRKKLRAKYKTPDSSSESNLILKNEIIGTFSVLGMSPSTQVGEVAGYCGKVEFRRQADSFGVEWLIASTEPNQVLHGTGILLDNSLSVAFQGPDGISGRTFTGLITYEIFNREVLTGTWTGLGIGIIGKEFLRRLA